MAWEQTFASQFTFILYLAADVVDYLVNLMLHTVLKAYHISGFITKINKLHKNLNRYNNIKVQNILL